MSAVSAWALRPLIRAPVEIRLLPLTLASRLTQDTPALTRWVSVQVARGLPRSSTRFSYHSLGSGLTAISFAASQRIQASGA